MMSLTMRPRGGGGGGVTVYISEYGDVRAL